MSSKKNRGYMNRRMSTKSIQMFMLEQRLLLKNIDVSILFDTKILEKLYK
jgi:hypothetical protein